MNITSKTIIPSRVSCVFEHDGKWYWADLKPVRFVGNECMIFRANRKGEVIDWLEVYCKRNIDVNEEQLMACVQDFCNGN